MAQHKIHSSESDIQDNPLLHRAALTCIAIAALISAISLAGWGLDILAIARISESFIPMAPSTALAFILLSSAVFVHIQCPEQRSIRIFTAGGVFIILSICLVIFLNNVNVINIDSERFLVPNPRKFGAVSMGRMSPVTAGCFLITAVSLLCLLALPVSKRSFKGMSVALAMAVGLIALWVLLGYLFGTLVLYKTSIIPVALNTAFAFMVLCSGIIASAGASYWPVSSLTGPSVKARLLRSFLPVTIAIVMIFSWLSTVIFTHLIDPALMAALSAILSIIIISLVVSKLSKSIGGAIDLAEAERRRAENELRVSEERYRSLFENMINGYAYCRMLFENGRPVDFMYLDVNSAFEQLTGLKNVIGKKVTDVIPGIKESDPELFEIYGRVARTGRPEKIEKFISALKSWFSASVYSPKREHFVVVFDVVTERKNLENQLLHAQKLEAVGQLAAGVAHEFNNILSAIVNYAYLLNNRMKEGDPSQAEVNLIYSLAMKASEITKGLLAYSRKHVINLVPVNLNNSVRTMERLLSNFIGEDVHLVIKLSADDPVILADSSQIEQIIMNLATNARDAMPGGGSLVIETGLLTIDDNFRKLHGFGSPGQYALLSLTDTGQGMDEETRKKIFDPFFSTKEVGKGTGLGLAIIYGIVSQYGGYIDVNSGPGRGTAFKIYFHSVREAVQK